MRRKDKQDTVKKEFIDIHIYDAKTKDGKIRKSTAIENAIVQYCRRAIGGDHADFDPTEAMKRVRGAYASPKPSKANIEEADLLEVAQTIYEYKLSLSAMTPDSDFMVVALELYVAAARAGIYGAI